MKSSRKNGFTLIELLIVVAIIGVLGAVGTPMYQGYLTSTKENTAKDNLQTIQFMQSELYRDSGQYFPCPKKKTSTSQIDKEFFGDKGDLSSGDYEYEIRGGCTGFIAYAFRAALDAKCFSIDPSKQLKDVSCPKMAPSGSPATASKKATVVKTSVLNQVEVLLSGHVQVRTLIRVIENGKTKSETFHRHVLSPGDNLTKQDPRVVAIAKAAWKPERMAAFKSNSKNKIIKKHRFK